MERKSNYEELGFKAGLEIHQQLDTGRKLFCYCPNVLRRDNPDIIITRKLHPISGETGDVDEAVKFESLKNKTFRYEGYSDTTCLVEYDESPPNLIDSEALKIVLQIAILLHAKIFSLTQVMRKTVIDGSNTSGFQRTALIARDGYIETKQGRIRIESICLEEDAARIIEKKENIVVYRLDRLGIPLVEIATAPDIKSPSQAREVALHIGDILRSCKVKRGLGTIRQDVNVSIKKGNRVEIKGVQKPELIIKAIDFEIKRQQDLVEKGEKIESEVRKALPDGKTEFLRPMPGAERMYPETDLFLLKISRNFINEVKRDLPRLRGEIEEELKGEGLTNELIKLVLEGYLDNFRELLKVYPKDPQLIAKLLTIWRNELATKLKKDIKKVNEVIDMEILEKLLKEVKKGNLHKNQLRPIFSDLMKGILLEDAIKTEKIDINVIEEKIMKIIKEKPGLSEKAYMGLVMKEFRGKLSGKEASETIQKYLK